MCNIVADVRAKMRICSDSMQDLILMWQALQKGQLTLPQCIGAKEYYSWRDDKTAQPSAIRGFIGFAFGYGGKFFGTFSRDVRKQWDLNASTNYSHRARTTLRQKLPYLHDVQFRCCDYQQWNGYVSQAGSNLTIKSLTISTTSPQFTGDVSITTPPLVIYCDPPYEGLAEYSTGAFDHKLFWDTMRSWSQHAKVFISEQHAPPDFIKVWSKMCRRILTSTTSKRTFVEECLWQWKGA